MNEYEMEWHIIKKCNDKKVIKSFNSKLIKLTIFSPLKTFTIGILGDNIKNYLENYKK